MLFVVLGYCNNHESASSDWICSDATVDLEIHKKCKGVFVTK